MPAHVYYQMDAQRALVLRFRDLIASHGDHFSETRVKDALRACEPFLPPTSDTAFDGPSQVARRVGYDELLGFAVSCIQDLLEDRRPDRCVLLPRDKVKAMNVAYERCQQMCETTMPRLDDVIASLTELRDRSRAALMVDIETAAEPSAAAAAPGASGVVDGRTPDGGA